MKFRTLILATAGGLLVACASEHREGTPRTEPEPAAPPPISRTDRGERDLADMTVTGEARKASADGTATRAAGHELHGPAPSTVGAVIAQDAYRLPSEPLYRERYERPDDNGVFRVTDAPVSTFSIDVDTGAYANSRRWLNHGRLPPEDAVRVEEFINYFDYADAPPPSADTPFAVTTEIAPTPWNEATHLLRIGVAGYRVPAERLPASNLVFLVDVSGSMNSPDKLPLLTRALSLLARQLDADDTISIVVYAGASGIALPPTGGDRVGEIVAALTNLRAGGSTNGAAGIRMAYDLARQGFVEGGVNRVILATDGDFNVGLASTDELIDLVERERASGIALTTLGFGTGNYNDHLMERLADAGDGNHAYIDGLGEARKVLAEELAATLLTIARDVKVQVEFNPAQVAEYRLVGYENRMLDEADFANDRVDAGDIGAGHHVTALYELSLVGSDALRLPPRRYGDAHPRPERAEHAADAARADEIAHLRLRWKRPGEERSRLIETPILRGDVQADWRDASADFRFAAAVAAFGQLLRGGDYLEAWSWDDIAKLASGARSDDPFGYRGEFLQLVRLAQTLADPQAVAGLRAGE